MNSILADAATEHVLTSLFEKMPLIGICLDIQGNVLYANPYFYTITGYSQEEVIGKNWFTTFIPTSQQSIIASTFQEIINKKSNSRFENPILTKSGDIRLISWTNEILNDSKDTLVGTISIGEDVTDLKGAETALLESEEKFRVLADIAQEGIVIHDKGMILFCNQKFADMGGYQVSEVVGKDVMTFMPPESGEIVKKHINDNIDECYRVTGHRKDGSEVPVEICSKQTMYHGQHVRVATIREVTQV